MEHFLGKEEVIGSIPIVGFFIVFDFGLAVFAVMFSYPEIRFGVGGSDK